jgi:hypothetical protein
MSELNARIFNVLNACTTMVTYNEFLSNAISIRKYIITKNIDQEIEDVL